MGGRFGHDTDLGKGLKVPLIWGPGAFANGLYELRDLMRPELSKRSIHWAFTTLGAAACPSMSEDA